MNIIFEVCILIVGVGAGLFMMIFPVYKMVTSAVEGKETKKEIKNMLKDGDKIKLNGTPRIVYICDRKAECNYSSFCGNLCKYTFDIKHAKNFKEVAGGFYEEIERGENNASNKKR